MLDALIAIRAVHAGAVIAAFGCAAFSWLLTTLTASSEAKQLQGDATPWLKLGALVAFAVAMTTIPVWIALQAAAVQDITVSQAFGDGSVRKMAFATNFGQMGAVRFVLACIAVSLLVRRPDRVSPFYLLGIAAALLATLTMASHAAAATGLWGFVRQLGDATHLLAAGAWLGTLAPFALALQRLKRQSSTQALAAELTARYAHLALVSVAVLAATGTLNAWELLGGVPGLLGTRYGIVFILKIILFAGMLALAAHNRLVLTPRIGNRGSADVTTRRLAQNALIELGLGCGVVILTATLMNLAPGAHDQPLWPFKVRPNWDEVEHSWLILLLVATGLGLVAATLPSKKWRALGAAVGLSMSVPLLPQLPTLFITAHPTSYASSPLDYSLSTVGAGKKIYADNCQSCHGEHAEGDGASGRGMRPRPANLTAEHAFAHPDGDLFWWISRGLATGMPAFGTLLPTQDIWAVIAFLHANADAAALKSVVNTVSMRGYPFPDLQLNCAGVDKSLSELRGRPIHLVARSKAEDIARIRATDEKAGLQTVVAGDAPGENCQVAATDRGLVDWLYGPDFDPSWRYELFIDTGGLLRGLWWPDAARTEADQLSQAMSRLARPGISARQSGGHAH